ncbi:cytochrome C assembly family protein [Motiliproteus sp.]|uniref:cytochrome C assembly family protein n=1 Tax=Motiliproteus sp. TaxID=1898955 RepID=UPI003BAB6118
MTLLLTSIFSALIYLLAGVIQASALSGNKPAPRSLVMMLGAGAWVLHTLSVYLILHPGNGIQLGLFPVTSLIAWLVSGLVILSCLKKPLTMLFVAIFPCASISVLLAALLPSANLPQQYSGGEIAHILTSILAYSIFAIAALQAIVLARQDHELRNHHVRGLVRSLPPLQLMEQLLFEMIWLGFALLSASLLTGLLFLQDIFAQHLVHKTGLSFIAWGLFAILLWGRHQKGWRGMKAIRWILGGFLFLMLAYFGSKFVLELMV